MHARDDYVFALARDAAYALLDCERERRACELAGIDSAPDPHLYARAVAFARRFSVAALPDDLAGPVCL